MPIERERTRRTLLEMKRGRRGRGNRSSEGRSTRVCHRGRSGGIGRSRKGTRVQWMDPAWSS